MTDQSQNLVDAIEEFNETRSNFSQLRKKLNLMLSKDLMILDDSTSIYPLLTDSTHNYSVMQRDIHRTLASTPNKVSDGNECKSQLDGLWNNRLDKKENAEICFKNPDVISSDAPFKCEKCGQSFSIEKNMVDHLKTEHLVQKPYICSICEKAFSHKGYLKHHKLSHSDKTIFECTRCDRSFNWKRHLYNHLRSLSAHKFPCDYCRKAFKSRSDRTVHTRQKHSKKKLIKQENFHDTPKQNETDIKVVLNSQNASIYEINPVQFEFLPSEHEFESRTLASNYRCK